MNGIDLLQYADIMKTPLTWSGLFADFYHPLLLLSVGF